MGWEALQLLGMSCVTRIDLKTEKRERKLGPLSSDLAG